MSQRISAPARPVTWAALAAAVLLIVVAAPPAPAQQKAAPKETKAAPKAAAPAAEKAQPAAASAQPAEQPSSLIYSPWTKFCFKSDEPRAKPSCFTGREARLEESGVPVAAAALIDPENDPKRRVLRVTLPLGMQLVPGTRVVIDQDRPVQRPYLVCFPNGCMAEYDATPDMINRLKKGRQLALQAINSSGQVVSLSLPLDGFAGAYDGPPTDPTAFEEQQKKAREEWERRVSEALMLERRQGPRQAK